MILYLATIEVPAAAADAIAAALEGSEAPQAVAVSAFERGPGSIEITAHYADAPPRDALLALLRQAACASEFGALRIEPVLERNWVAEAEALRGPVHAGRFLVHGSHDRAKVQRKACTFEIDAGLAFGTAHHATTRGCLLALDRLLKRSRPRTVLDIGTGTGILAIAAARALNVDAIASDIDPVAVATAKENARRNGVAARVEVVEAAGLDHPALREAEADLLFANILMKPLLQLAPDFARAVAPGGVCILSGLLATQAPQVEAKFRAHGFILNSQILLVGWATLVMVRASARPGFIASD